MRSSKTEGKTSSVASAVRQVAPSCWNQNVANILFFNFCEQEFVQHGPITIAIDCNGLYLLILKEKWPNYASGLKSASNSDLFWVRRLFNVCVRIFCASNMKILLVYIPPRSKWTSSENMSFFLPKSASSVSRLQAQLAALFKRIYNHIRSAGG